MSDGHAASSETLAFLKMTGWVRKASISRSVVVLPLICPLADVTRAVVVFVLLLSCFASRCTAQVSSGHLWRRDTQTKQPNSELLVHPLPSNHDAVRLSAYTGCAQHCWDVFDQSVETWLTHGSCLEVGAKKRFQNYLDH